MSRATIVLAEDDPSVLQAVGDSLQDAGYAVLRAASGREALLKLSAGVDLLITDLWMPGIDGLALLARAKADFPLTEVVLITGNATVPSAVAAMKAGAFDYLTKPFTPPDLLDAVERAVVLSRNETLQTSDLPQSVVQGPTGSAGQLIIPIGMPMDEIERRVIFETLRHTQGDKTLAARLLGIASRTIYRRLERG